MTARLDTFRTDSREMIVANPKPGSQEWQDRLNEEIEKHDAQQRNSGNENQEFEIGQGQ